MTPLGSRGTALRHIGQGASRPLRAQQFEGRLAGTLWVGGDFVGETVTAGVLLGPGAIAVPLDVGKLTAMAMMADSAGERLVAPFTFSLDRLFSGTRLADRPSGRGGVSRSSNFNRRTHRLTQRHRIRLHTAG